MGAEGDGRGDERTGDGSNPLAGIEVFGRSFCVIHGPSNKIV